MTDYVVDSSILVQGFVRESYSPFVVNLLKTLKTGNRLIVPEIGLTECTNVLWKHVRFEGVALEDAREKLAELNLLPLDVRPVRDILDDSFVIAVKYQLAIYDCLFIALAKGLKAPLITVDNKQAKAAAGELVTLKPITDFIPPKSPLLSDD
ncbi:MAG: type II toxin-antitoxin system VapC family toxin [Phototrophicaceae bacterium]|jgi:predicted nucleic acid-binding protein